MIITLTPRPAGPLAPHVEVAVTDPPEDAATVTVTRTAQRRSFLVRGFVDSRTDGALFTRDVEMPFGVPVSYTAEARDADGSVVGIARSADIVQHSTTGGTIWVHDPIRPAVSVELRLEVDAIRGGARSLNGDVVAIPGQSVPVSVNAVRSGWSGVVFDAVTFTPAQAETFDGMFGGYDSASASGVLCIRPSEDIPALVPRTFFARVDKPTPDFHYPNQGRKEIIWRLSATEVLPPTPALVEPIVTWADLAAYWNARGGWAAFNAGNANGVEVTRDLRPLSAAG